MVRSQKSERTENGRRATEVKGKTEAKGQRTRVTQVEHPEGVRFNRAPRGGIFDPK